MKIKALMILSMLELGCSNTYKTSLNKIIDEDNILKNSVDFEKIPEEVAFIMSSVGKMEESSCTVFSIGNGLALTAGHCIIPYQGYAVENYACHDKIYWGIERVEGICEMAITAVYTKELDYAILRVSMPESQVILDTTKKDIIGYRIGILGFASDSKEMMYSQGFSGDNNDVKNANDTNIVYNADTLAGFSGSPIIDLDTGYVIGIHTSKGRKNESWNIGQLIDEKLMNSIER